jgi:hypothetical protein
MTQTTQASGPAFASARYLMPSAGAGSREERDRLLAEAEIILGGWPFPLVARAPRLKWFHQAHSRQSDRRGKSAQVRAPRPPCCTVVRRTASFTQPTPVRSGLKAVDRDQ